MKNRSTSISFIILLTTTMLIGVSHIPEHVGAVSNANVPVVGVWSNTCQSFNITVANPSCGPLGVNSPLSVQINVTNTQPNQFAGYEFYLYFDPSFLSPTGYDTTNTVFSNPFVIKNDFSAPGVAHIAGACLHCNDTGPGTIISIKFNVLALGGSPLTLAAGISPAGFAQSFTELGVAGNQASFTLVPNTADGYFQNDLSRRGPVASFTFAPTLSRQKQQINFSATGSYDPDNYNAPNHGISLYVWDFGNGYATSTSSQFFQFSPSLSGNYSVRLTVIDSDNTLEGMKAQPYYVSITPFHDMEIQSVNVNPTVVKPGGKISVSVIVKDNGTFIENYNLTVAYGSPPTIAGATGNQTIRPQALSTFPVTIDTTGLSPGVYQLNASITTLPSVNNTRAVDQIPVNDVYTTSFQVESANSSDFSALLLIAGGGVGVVAALAAVGLLMKRRARARAEE